METNYLESVKRQFEYYKLLGEQTIAQVSEEELFWRYNEESNSIAFIVQHLHGNMLSRWTDFLTSDGEKEWRNRDSEFEAHVQSKDELMERWNKGWDCLFNAINGLNEEDLSRTVYIRNQGQTVVDTINRQLAHYPYHIGQIVFLGKMMRDNHWKSLSIPKGKSNVYNAEKFAQPKHKEHFTEEYLKNKNDDK